MAAATQETGLCTLAGKRLVAGGLDFGFDGDPIRDVADEADADHVIGPHRLVGRDFDRHSSPSAPRARSCGASLPGSVGRDCNRSPSMGVSAPSFPRAMRMSLSLTGCSVGQSRPKARRAVALVSAMLSSGLTTRIASPDVFRIVERRLSVILF